MANLPHSPRLREAASAPGEQPFFVDGISGVGIEIRPLMPGTWHLLVDVRTLAIPSGAELSLRDDQGREWLRGPVPEDGELFDFWRFDALPETILTETDAIGLFIDGLELVPMTRLVRGGGDG